MLILNQENKRKLLEESWKRCQQTGLTPYDSPKKQYVSEQEIMTLTQKNEKLIYYTSSLFKKIHMKNHKFDLLDASGRLIYSFGSIPTPAKFDEEFFRLGICWSETARGTNAVSLALSAKAPIVLYGNEHFFQENHWLTCVACPVYSPDGKVIAVINISSETSLFNKSLIQVAAIAAESLQNQLLVDNLKKERLIYLHELDQLISHTKRPLISIDSDNNILRANKAARQILGEDCVGKQVPENKNIVLESISDSTNKYWQTGFIKTKKQSAENENQLYTFSNIKGSCARIQSSIQLAKRAALTDFPVLLLGESGTGKELFAQSIHSHSERADQPFIAVNCSAIPENLVESELFGYTSGAFTGANNKGRKGKFEAANGGTIFLDEIGDMSLKAQSALLRVLQESVITPVGGTESKPIDVRVIAATHRNLPQEIEEGRFRHDLYYRLKGIQITLPPLRNRTDKVELAEYLLANINSWQTLSESAKRKIDSYHWPGNIRELRSVLVQASFLANGSVISAEHIQIETIPNAEQESAEIQPKTLQDKEYEAIIRALQDTNWNVKRAAEQLQIGRNTLYRKMKIYNIERPS